LALGGQSRRNLNQRRLLHRPYASAPTNGVLPFKRALLDPIDSVSEGLTGSGLTGSYARVSVDDLLKAVHDDTWSTPSTETSSGLPRGRAPFAAELAPMAANAQRLSLVMQDMAAFGGGAAIHDQEIGRERIREPVDFFA
jgi:hypothetical protein